jgi:hypothetical protein
MGRSSVDQIASLTNIIDVRKKLRISTFCAFIDFKKAYDAIDRICYGGSFSVLSNNASHLHIAIHMPSLHQYPFPSQRISSKLSIHL